MKETFSKIIKEVKDCLFPVYCLECGKEGEWVCEKCLRFVKTEGVFFCPLCHTKTENGVACPVCWDRSFLAAQVSVASYKEGSLMGKMIESFKYNYAEELADVFEKMIDEFLDAHTLIFSPIDLIVMVPLHRRRYAERGFNQAQVITRILSRFLDRPVAGALERIRNTRQQAKLNREQRIENMRGAFGAKEKRVSGTVLLVDDVFTTGSTMQECAKVLKSAGAEKVIGFTLARG